MIRHAGSGPPGDDVAGKREIRARTLLAEAVAEGLPEAEIQKRCREILTGFRAGAVGGLAR